MGGGVVNIPSWAGEQSHKQNCDEREDSDQRLRKEFITIVRPRGQAENQVQGQHGQKEVESVEKWGTKEEPDLEDLEPECSGGGALRDL